MTTKMNEQTVFVTFPGSSTLEFQTIQCVPVYEPAECGWIRFIFHSNTITTVNKDGDVERTFLSTGRVERWYTRPSIQNVVTLNMKHKIGGYCFEFGQDGSIRSSCKEGTYYWGPVKLVESERDMGIGITRDPVAWDELVDMHWQSTDPMQCLKSGITAWWDRQSDKRWWRNTSLEEEIEGDRAWANELRERVNSDSRVYENADVCAAYEEQIASLEHGISHNQSIIDGACPECRREGVCMCYT